MFVESAVARVPVPALLPSGMFVREGNALPVGALMVSSFTLKPKKAAGIVAIELLRGSAPNIETSLRTLIGEDIGLMIDGSCSAMPRPRARSRPAWSTASRRSPRQPAGDQCAARRH
jgi:hypothetical protein